MKKIVLLSLTASTLLLASGWRIPEQSSRSVALSGAYVANSNGADASYYNPANMAWNDDTNLIEMDLTYINLPSLKYEGTVTIPPTTYPANAESKEEQFLLPTLFFSSKDYDGFRYGLSITAPGGLSKRWDAPLQKTYAEEFTLKIIELNPSISYKVNSKFAIGGGLRILYTYGKVRSSGTIARDMEGDTTDFGYNLAATYKPSNKMNLSATYRSNVDLEVEGNAKLYASGTKLYDGGADVTVPLPAVLSLALSYDINKDTTLELEYDRTYWSKYKTLDFNYKSPIPVILYPYFDKPISKNWKDSDAYRIGITHQYSDKLKLMAGFAIDKTPIPSQSLGFELPSSDAKLYSVGFEYKYSKKITLGMGYLYDSKEDRTINGANIQGINGTFKDISAHLVTLGFKYRF